MTVMATINEKNHGKTEAHADPDLKSAIFIVVLLFGKPSTSGGACQTNRFDFYI